MRKKVLTEIQTKAIWAEAAIALPTESSPTNIVVIILPTNINDHTISSVFLENFYPLEIYICYYIFWNLITVFKIKPM